MGLADRGTYSGPSSATSTDRHLRFAGRSEIVTDSAVDMIWDVATVDVAGRRSSRWFEHEDRPAW